MPGRVRFRYTATRRLTDSDVEDLWQVYQRTFDAERSAFTAAVAKANEVLGFYDARSGALVGMTLVRAWATRHDDGTLDVLVWNGTVNADLLHGDPRLVRDVSVTLTGLTATSYVVELARIDEQHSNIGSAASGADWPDEAEWRALRAADHLSIERIDDLSPDSGTGTVTVTVPQPGVVRIRLLDGDAPSATDEERTP